MMHAHFAMHAGQYTPHVSQYGHALAHGSHAPFTVRALGSASEQLRHAMEYERLRNADPVGALSARSRASQRKQRARSCPSRMDECDTVALYHKMCSVMHDEQRSSLVYTIVQCIAQFAFDRCERESTASGKVLLRPGAVLAGSAVPVPRLHLYYDETKTNEFFMDQYRRSMENMDIAMSLSSSSDFGVQVAEECAALSLATPPPKRESVCVQTDRRQPHPGCACGSQSAVEPVAKRNAATQTHEDGRGGGLSLAAAERAAMSAEDDISRMNAACARQVQRADTLSGRAAVLQAQCDELRAQVETERQRGDRLQKQLHGERRRISQLESSTATTAKHAQQLREATDKCELLANDLHNARQQRDELDNTIAVQRRVSQQKVDMLKHAVKKLSDDKHRLERGTKATSDLTLAMRDRMIAAESKLASVQLDVDDAARAMDKVDVYERIMLAICCGLELDDARPRDVYVSSCGAAGGPQSEADSRVHAQAPAWKDEQCQDAQEMEEQWTQQEVDKADVDLFVDCCAATSFRPLGIPLARALRQESFVSHIANHTLLDIANRVNQCHDAADGFYLSSSLCGAASLQRFRRMSPALAWTYQLLEQADCSKRSAHPMFRSVNARLQQTIQSACSAAGKSGSEGDSIMNRVYELLGHTTCSDEMLMSTMLSTMYAAQNARRQEVAKPSHSSHAIATALSQRVLTGAMNKLYESMYASGWDTFATFIVRNACERLDEALKSTNGKCRAEARCITSVCFDRRYADDNVRQLIVERGCRLLDVRIDLGRSARCGVSGCDAVIEGSTLCIAGSVGIMERADGEISDHLCCVDPVAAKQAASLYAQGHAATASCADKAAGEMSNCPTALGVALNAIVNSSICAKGKERPQGRARSEADKQAEQLAAVSLSATAFVNVAKTNAAAHVRPFALYAQACEGALYAAVHAAMHRSGAAAALRRAHTAVRAGGSMQDNEKASSCAQTSARLLDIMTNYIRSAKARADLPVGVRSSAIRTPRPDAETCSSDVETIQRALADAAPHAACATEIRTVSGAAVDEVRVLASGDDEYDGDEARHATPNLPTHNVGALAITQRDGRLVRDDALSGSRCAQVQCSCVVSFPPCDRLIDQLPQSFQYSLATGSSHVKHRDVRGTTARERASRKLADKRRLRQQLQASQGAAADEADTGAGDSAGESVAGIVQYVSTADVCKTVSREAREAYTSGKQVSVRVSCCALPKAWTKGPMNAFERQCHISVHKVDFDNVGLLIFVRVCVRDALKLTTVAHQEVKDVAVQHVVARMSDALHDLGHAEVDNVHVHLSNEDGSGRKVSIERVFQEIAKQLCGHSTDTFMKSIRKHISKIQRECGLGETERLVVDIA